MFVQLNLMEFISFVVMRHLHRFDVDHWSLIIMLHQVGAKRGTPRDRPDVRVSTILPQQRHQWQVHCHDSEVCTRRFAVNCKTLSSCRWRCSVSLSVACRVRTRDVSNTEQVRFVDLCVGRLSYILLVCFGSLSCHSRCVAAGYRCLLQERPSNYGSARLLQILQHSLFAGTSCESSLGRVTHTLGTGFLRSIG